MGCIDSCLHCLSLVPWATLIALVICWAGTALFCGAQHAAIANMKIIFDELSLEWTYVEKTAQSLQYSIYGIAGFIFLLTVLLFVDGLLSTRAVKHDYDSGCKPTCCGIAYGVIMTVFTYLTGIGWILITCASTLPVYFYFVTRQQCDAINNLEDDSTADNFCIYLDQTGIVEPGTNKQICGEELTAFCSNETVNLTQQLFLIGLIGAASALLSIKHFLMSLSSNYAYSKMQRKLAVYEDAKFREEMELNDIINTARSNERLTYKY